MTPREARIIASALNEFAGMDRRLEEEGTTVEEVWLLAEDFEAHAQLEDRNE